MGDEMNSAGSSDKGSIQPAEEGIDPKVPGPVSVLEDIVELLEGYGPTWYTEDLRHRATGALLKGSITVNPRK